MNQGVEILLKRMETNPEEFVVPFDRYRKISPEGKWGAVVHSIIREINNKKSAGHGPVASATYPELPFLTDEEIELLYNKLMSLQGDQFTQHVLRTLLEDKKEPGLETVVQSSGYYHAGLGVSAPLQVKMIGGGSGKIVVEEIY